jgi:uncharacterized membrane protein YfcA
MLLLFGAALLAGTMNAVAGGGSFVSFPALLYAGVPSVVANATSTVALFPGAFASAYAYRAEFRGFHGVSLPVMLGVSVTGGLLGAVLLLVTPSSVFDVLVPWLLLVGALAFAFGAPLGIRLRRVVRIGVTTLIVAQFLLGLYGGFFGGAVGIMMMATWSVFGMSDIKAMAAGRTFLTGATNATAVICFVIAGVIWWVPALVMLVAGLIGGYGGARLARRVPPDVLRRAIVVLNFAITAAVFYRTYV